ncbi:helix-turn-helix transcriptional regulator [Rouxiella badensis]|uniref:AraC family transcriptional regulator n=1 Tax=Rouxiella badensis TaxID=1646377 RepID=UPI001D14E34B|nr:helix-turn-helix transcriptional regulator [Rouxiella badensis]MCC3738315.1 helix-turn-helix transcriptional regulator [Rouxiella badensis]
MPIIQCHPGDCNRVAIDDIERPVIAVGASRTNGSWEKAMHCHRKAQLIYTLEGIISCELEQGVWVVPPQCAVWIPSGLMHSARGTGVNQCYSLFVEPDANLSLPTSCCTLSVTPLLRELLLHAAHFPLLYDEQGPEGKIINVLLDQLTVAEVEDLYLPLPRDNRLRQLTDGMLQDPADKSTLAEWAGRIGMSERSLSRTFVNQVGVSVHRWRKQLHVILALQKLSGGASVQTVALDLGYESASSFVTMFRKAQGKPPARYLSDSANSPDLPIRGFSLSENMA